MKSELILTFAAVMAATFLWCYKNHKGRQPIDGRPEVEYQGSVIKPRFAVGDSVYHLTCKNTFAKDIISSVHINIRRKNKIEIRYILASGKKRGGSSSGGLNIMFAEDWELIDKSWSEKELFSTKEDLIEYIESL